MEVTSRHHYQIVSKGQAKHSDYSTESRSCWHITCLAFCLCWNAAREKGESALTNLRPSTKAEEGWRKKKAERKRIWQYHTPNFCHLLQRVWGDITVGLTVWRGCSTRKAMHVMERHFQRAHTLHDSARPTECDLASVVCSQHRPGLSLPALGYVALCSTAVLVISPTGDINEKIFLAR